MSDNAKMRLGVQLTGEDNYGKVMSKIGTAMKNVSAQQRLLNSQFAKGDQSLAKNAQQQELLKQKLDIQRQKLAAIAKEHARVAAKEGENSEAAQDLARGYAYAEAACNKTEQELKDLDKTMAKATSRVEAFKAELKKGGGELEKIGKKVTEVGDKLTTRLTLPLAAGAGASLKLFMDFENEGAKLSTVADESVKSLETLKEEALEASNETGVAAKEIVASAYDAISSGVSTEDSMGFIEEAAKAAKAGLTDINTTVNGSTSIMNAWKIATEDATTVFDKMIVAQDEGKTTLGEISSQIGNLTGLAPQLGVSLDEVLASTAALTKNGVMTSQAMNGLKNMMAGVLKPTAEAKKTAKELGIEFNATALKSKGLTGFLADIQEKTKGDEEALAKLFGSVEGLSSVLLLGGAAANDYSDILAKMGDSAGKMEAGYQKVTSSRAEQMKKALNQLANEGIKLGQALAPGVDLATNALSSLAGVLERMTPEQQKTALTIAAITAGIGPLVGGIGRAITTFTKLQKTFKAFSALAGGAGPLALWIAGITAAVVAIVALKNHLDSLKGVNQLKAEFGKITVDTAAIDEAIEEAELIQHEMDLNIQAKTKLTVDSKNLQDEIIDWLSDGKKNTTKQKNEYKAKADEVFAPVYEAIETSFREKKAALDEALSTGIIDQAEYDRQMEALKGKTEETKTALGTEKQAYVDYVMQLAKANRDPTQAELDKLEELRQKVVSVGDALLDATNKATQAARASYSLVKAGGGTEKDVALAVSYLQGDRATKLDKNDQLYKSTMADLQTKLDEAEANGDLTLVGRITTAMEFERQKADENEKEINRQYTEMLNELFDGLAEKYPEQVEKLKAAMQKQNLYEDISLLWENWQNAGVKDFDGAKLIWEKLFPDKEMPELSFVNLMAIAQDIEDGLDQLKLDAKAAIKDSDFTDLFTDLSTAISSGATTGLDLRAATDVIKTALSAIDLTDDGKTITEQLIAGEVQGIAASRDDLNTAIIKSAEEANEALKNKQGIHSPSTVWEGFGINQMEGEARGFEKGTPLVIMAVNRLSDYLYAAGKNTVDSWIKGANANRGRLIATYTSIAAAAIKAAKDELQIRSPSKPFRKFGENTGDSLIRGVLSRVEAVRKAYGTMANPAGAIATATAAGGNAAGQTQGGTTIVNVNHYGAMTNRENRRLGQSLGRYMQQQKKAQGE